MKPVFLLTLGAAMLAALPLAASGQAFPDRPLRLIVPLAPGGGNDAAARAVAGELAKRKRRLDRGRSGAGDHHALLSGHGLMLGGLPECCVRS